MSATDTTSNARSVAEPAATDKALIYLRLGIDGLGEQKQKVHGG